jgi:hypothetical protein
MCQSLSEQSLTLESLNKKTNKCNVCNCDLDPFVTFDIQSQLIQVLNDNKIFQQVTRSNTKPKSAFLNDAVDGSIYHDAKRLNTNLISLNLNTDGARITNSKHYDMWPLIASIVELEPISRESFNNMIILGTCVASNQKNF